MNVGPGDGRWIPKRFDTERLSIVRRRRGSRVAIFEIVIRGSLRNDVE